jgi:hypothetical protein
VRHFQHHLTTHDVGNAEVEEDVHVIEESFIKMKKDKEIDFKQEEIPEDITFPDIKAEPDEVSYVCICLFLDTYYQGAVFYINISGR